MGVSWRLRPLEVRATLRTEGGIIHPRGAPVPRREGLVPPTSRSPSLLATADLPRPLCGGPRPFPPSGKQLARCLYGGGARDSPKDSAVCTHSLGPVLALAVQPPRLQGLPRFPPWPQGAALTPQQEEEAERCGWPHAGRRDPRAAGGTLCLERGHRVASRRGEAAALRRAGAGAPISPAPEAGSRAASSQGLGQRRPRGGRG